MTNRLADEASTYLRQHADNPVDWRPWSAEAFDEARERRVPVLLSVGYAACHWCHVMAHESFADPGIAAVMNERFVCVKVDRQERPDVDAVYMQATVAMTGSGGWPMTCFLTPDARPFYCGTYYPPVARGGMPGFGELLVAVSEAWSGRRDDVERTAAAVADRLGDLAAPAGDGTRLPVLSDRAEVTATIGRGLDLLQRDEDPAHGGWGGAPKFPPSTVLELLLRRASTRDVDGDRAWGMAERTLLAMARSGMADQLAGGFARYSVDAGWVVPHFEKMLYDNALLLRMFTLAAAHGGPHATEFARVARGCADFLLRDLGTPDGLFAAALDADTPGEGEGATYVWTPAQLAAALGPDDGTWVAQVCGVTDVGTFEHGSSTLRLLRRLDDEPTELARWETLRARLAPVRRARVQPIRDDLVVAGWNGLAVGALAGAGVVFDEPEWTRRAVLAARALLDVHEVEPGMLVRSSSNGAAGSARGVLEDYAGVAVGLLAVFGVTGDRVLVEGARRLLDAVATRFSLDDAGGLADTDSAAPALLVRPGDVSDNATPSARYLAADAFTTLAGLTGEAVWSERAAAAVGPALTLGDRAPRAVGWGLAVAWSAVTGPIEVAVLGDAGDPRRARLLAVAVGTPGVTLATAAPGDAPAVPLLAERTMTDDRPTAYLCRHFVCSRPTTEPDELAAALREILDPTGGDRD